MAKENTPSTEKFKTMIGGQALIEGIMMRGPKQDAIVVRGSDGLSVEVSDRKIYKPGSVATWPLIRGAVNFFDAQVMGVKALMRSVDERNPKPFYAQLEQELLEEINALGIGPQGFGGKTTALAVNIEEYPTHIAGLPVAVNINCHVTRHKTEVL